MTTLLFSVLAATSLAAAGVSAPTETRSAQALPSDHLVEATGNTAATGKLKTVNHMTDGAGNEWDHSNHGLCDAHHWHWNDKENLCHRGIDPVVPIIGAGATAGFIYALTSRGNNTGQSGASN